jgi:thioredoxin 1
LKFQGRPEPAALPLLRGFLPVSEPAILFFIIFANMEKVITSVNIEEFLAEPGLLVIDFWAVWCGPCRMLSPIVDELASEFEGRATVAKCNVDDCEDVAIRFGVRNIPTLVFIKNGEVVDRTVGVLPKPDLKARIEAAL